MSFDLDIPQGFVETIENFQPRYAEARKDFIKDRLDLRTTRIKEEAFGEDDIAVVKYLAAH
jgi:hypothetical protein